MAMHRRGSLVRCLLLATLVMAVCTPVKAPGPGFRIGGIRGRSGRPGGGGGRQNAGYIRGYGGNAQHMRQMQNFNKPHRQPNLDTQQLMKENNWIQKEMLSQRRRSLDSYLGWSLPVFRNSVTKAPYSPSRTAIKSSLLYGKPNSRKSYDDDTVELKKLSSKELEDVLKPFRTIEKKLTEGTVKINGQGSEQVQSTTESIATVNRATTMSLKRRRLMEHLIRHSRY